MVRTIAKIWHDLIVYLIVVLRVENGSVNAVHIGIGRMGIENKILGKIPRMATVQSRPERRRDGIKILRRITSSETNLKRDRTTHISFVINAARIQFSSPDCQKYQVIC